MRARRVEGDGEPFWYHEHEFTCPGCNQVVDCHSAAPGQELGEPRAGDLNGCLYCGQLSVIEVSAGGIVSLREITPAEQERAERVHPDAIQQIKEMAETMAVVQQARRARWN